LAVVVDTANNTLSFYTDAELQDTVRAENPVFV
jgi:hypothetical protein